jgi:RNA polymerase sigma-70 factor (ECF subfamily)
MSKLSQPSLASPRGGENPMRTLWTLPLFWSVNCCAEAMQPRLDSELLEEGRNGDGQALSELFERHYTSSVRVARRILRSEEEACDAVQSAYLAAFEHLHGFREDAQFNTWITRIVKNQCFMYLRRPERWRVCCNLEEEYVRDGVWALADRTPTPEDLLWRRELDSAFSVAAGKLPKRLRDVYTLCCTSGLSVREAAHSLGLTVAATKARLFRAQHRMQSLLGTRLMVRAQRKTSGANPPTIARSRIAA